MELYIYIIIGIVLAFIILFFWPGNKHLSKISTPEPEEFEFTFHNFTIKGVRYPNHGAQPFLLIHGYAGNSRNWRELGHYLYEKGYDVWMPNFRGHGKGSHKSYVHNEFKHCYAYKYILTEDIPAIVDKVSKITKKKIHIIAHSLGSIATRAFLSGIHITANNEIKVDEDHARMIAKEKVKSLSMIGGPPHFKNIPKFLKLMSKFLPVLNEQMSAFNAELSPDDLDKKENELKVTHKITHKILSKFDSYNRNHLIRSVAELSNFDTDEEEFSRLMKKGLSNIPNDLVYDVRRWIKHGEIFIDHINLSTTRKIYVPLLIIAGELDQLAPFKDVFQDAENYRPLTPVQTLLVKGTSHIDLIAGKKAKEKIGGVLVDFSTQPISNSPGNHKRI